MAPNKNDNTIPMGAHYNMTDLATVINAEEPILEYLREGNDNMICCVPRIQCVKNQLIRRDELNDTVRVICSNNNCTAGNFMHLECYESWEKLVLGYLRACGRAKSWSDKQKLQNLWNRKGYDVIFRSCTCRCGKGYLKRDKYWKESAFHPETENTNQNVKRRRKKQQKSKMSQSNQEKQKPPKIDKPLDDTIDYNNNSSVYGSDNLDDNNNSATDSNRNELGIVIHEQPSGKNEGDLIFNNKNIQEDGKPYDLLDPIFNILPSNDVRSNPIDLDRLFFVPKAARNPNLGPILKPDDIDEKRLFRLESMRGNGIFTRRENFKNFNMLPKHRLNAYNVKLSDDGNNGNDETRVFVLSNLASNKQSRMCCVMCSEPLDVFDRYPLINGTFFLSPVPRHHSSIEVVKDNRKLFLSAICIACLEGRDAGRCIRCRFCGTTWDGSMLIIGTMYCYDIFAAKPCCVRRVECNYCFMPMIESNKKLKYFSEYSRTCTCPHCGVIDYHFIKPLAQCFGFEGVP